METLYFVGEPRTSAGLCGAGRKKVTVGILPGRYPNRKAGHSGVGVPGSSHGDGVQSPGRAPWAIMAEGG